MDWILKTLVASVFLYTLLRLWRYRKQLKASQRRGCYPPPSIQQKDPIFGLDILVHLFQALRQNRRNKSLSQLFDTYGHTFQSKSWSGTKFYTIEPKNIQSVLATDFANWGVQPMRLFAFEPFVGKGIMCSDGSFWEHSRAMIKPTFARTQIADIHLKMFDVHVQRLIDAIPNDSSTIDLQPLFSRLALDSSTEFLFGESVGSLSPATVSSDVQAFLDAYNYGQLVLGKRLQLPHWNLLTIDQRFRHSCRVAHSFVDKYIANSQRVISDQKEKKSHPDRFILAHELLEKTKDVRDVRNQLLNVFLPAHEATGVALTNVFFHLARNPTIYGKLRQEISEAGSDGDLWTFERLKSLRQLQNVINETFRLNPTIGTTVRMALHNTVLPTGGGGLPQPGKAPIHVNKGDIVTFSLYALHRRKDIFGPDAGIFRPERWNNLRPPHWSYMSFGGGPRVCPGQNLALTEVAYTVVKILQTFKEIENRDPVMDFIEVYKITTDSRNGAKVSFSR